MNFSFQIADSEFDAVDYCDDCYYDGDLNDDYYYDVEAVGYGYLDKAKLNEMLKMRRDDYDSTCYGFRYLFSCHLFQTAWLFSQ